MDVASRLVGRGLALGASTTTRVVFGPFFSDEVVSEFRLFLEEINAVIGDSVQIEIAAFTADPGSGVSATAFAANGRLLTNGTCLLPVLARTFRIPVGFRATDKERWLVVQFTELNGDTPDGSIWLVVR